MSDSKLVVVTGAAQGIGESIAHAFAVAGFDVVVNDINIMEHGDALAKRWQTSQRVLTVAADIGDESAVESLFDTIDAEFGRPATYLVNNAGIQTWSTLVDLSLEDWNRTLRTNLTGCFLMTQRFARRCIAYNSSGAIVNIGSGCNRLAFPSLVDYSASKGGIEMLTKVAALELGPQGIRVNCVAPGAIAIERTTQETSDYAQQWSELTPLGRVGLPDDVAKTVLYLASDAADFVSGQTLHVDGGLFSRAIWPQAY